MENVGVLCVGDSLQMSYDALGNKYDLPVFVINEPASYEAPKRGVQQFDVVCVKVS